MDVIGYITQSLTYELGLTLIGETGGVGSGAIWQLLSNSTPSLFKIFLKTTKCVNIS